MPIALAAVPGDRQTDGSRYSKMPQYGGGMITAQRDVELFASVKKLENRIPPTYRASRRLAETHEVFSSAPLASPCDLACDMISSTCGWSPGENAK